MSDFYDLSYLLGPRGRISRIGPETGRAVANGIACFVYNGAMGQSRRYVYSKGGVALAALQIMVPVRRVPTVANVFTAPSARRRGLATALLDRAEADLGPVADAQDLSDDGQTWT